MNWHTDMIDHKLFFHQLKLSSHWYFMSFNCLLIGQYSGYNHLFPIPTTKQEKEEGKKEKKRAKAIERSNNFIS